jgi:ribosomal protein S18 acetylase RimI-like enzyme
MGHPLDNPVWHALTGPHLGIALGRGQARHYPRDVVPFSAIAEPTSEAYADLAADLPPRAEARLFPADEPSPPRWESISSRQILQMVADRVPEPVDATLTIHALGWNEVAEALVLAEVAKPGPFKPRTIVLGEYFGVRDAAGRLLAMGGERFRLPSHAELSAICVHPEARGLGLGSTLTRHLMHRIFSRGEAPFLHVFPENPAAALYARLGFRERSRLCVLWRRPAAGAGEQA